MVKVCIKTQGCSHNQSDSERMAGIISSEHEIVHSEEEADLVLFNTCTVKTKTENSFLKNLRKVEKKGKKIIIGGCIAQSEPSRFTQHSTIGTHSIHHIREVINATINNKIIHKLGKKELPLISGLKIKQNKARGIVPINLGCLGGCSFCKTKSARGTLKSYPVLAIVNAVREELNNGSHEIWLTSQDTACYGFDLKTNVAFLLKEICKIPKKFKIRLGMGNPDSFLKFKEELAEALMDEKVYKFLHLPVQSGSNSVLKKMRRLYTIEEFKELVNYLRLKIPDITLSTDVIVGFPEETEEDFQQTLNLCKELKFDSINISRFWLRPGTDAENLKQLTSNTIKERGQRMTKLHHQISCEKNKEWIGWQGEVLIIEEGKNDTTIGRNYAYKQVVLKRKEGPFTEVKIVGFGLHDLKGETIKSKERILR